MHFGIGISRCAENLEVAAIAQLDQGSCGRVANLQGIVEILDGLQQCGNGLMFPYLSQGESRCNSIVRGCCKMGGWCGSRRQTVHGFWRIHERPQKRLVPIGVFKSA